MADRVDVALHEVAAEAGCRRAADARGSPALPRAQRSERRHAHRLRARRRRESRRAPRRITVRQTPLTARLSPGAARGASGDAIRRRKPPLVGLRSTSSPTASTRPVNISLNQHVGTERLDAPLDELRRRKRPSVEERHAAGPEHVRRDVEPHVVDERLRPTRAACSAAPPSSSSDPICRARRAARSAARSVPSRGDLDLARRAPRAACAAPHAPPPRPSSR